MSTAECLVVLKFVTACNRRKQKEVRLVFLYLYEGVTEGGEACVIASDSAKVGAAALHQCTMWKRLA